MSPLSPTSPTSPTSPMGPAGQRILVVNLNPTFQQSFFYRSFTKNDVNRAYAHNEQIAGKGFNLVRILSLLGKHPIYLSHLGRSRFHEVEAECRSLGIEMAYVLSDSPMRTCVTILESDTHQTTELTCEAEPVSSVPSEDSSPDLSSGSSRDLSRGTSSGSVEDGIRKLFQKYIADPSVRWLIISGTQAPGYTPSLYPDMVRLAHEHGVSTVLDLADANLLGSLPHHPTVIKPNRKEFERTFSISGASDPEFEAKVREVASTYKITVVVTCGERGAYVAASGALGADAAFGAGGAWLPVAEFVPEPVNATGCGDVFTAGLTSVLADDGDLPAAILFGSQCAARRVRRMDVGL